MTITESEARRVVKLIVSADGRTVNDWQLFGEMWADVLDGITYDEAIDAVIEHYRATSEPIWPCEIRESAFAARAIEAFAARADEAYRTAKANRAVANVTAGDTK